MITFSDWPCILIEHTYRYDENVTNIVHQKYERKTLQQIIDTSAQIIWSHNSILLTIMIALLSTTVCTKLYHNVLSHSMYAVGS